ncbi:hypothetical protein KLP40_08320 [Hymenobacter sp. NST-14]|uniref:hypothetical protein n=1 Tax=Hymenobacter piscis TaxID=2839984 RepID=UPI001C00DFC5|nr:hypothetical protein [Hymenobacter piscis]MBT9393167.1 hypothetical protein [Hymenobacter piscis]
MKPKSYRKKAARQPAVRRYQLALARQAALLVDELRAELPHLLAVAVVDVASGASLAAHAAAAGGLDLTLATRFQLGLVRCKHQALVALQLPREQLEDILITLSSQLHLLRLTGTGRQLISLVVDARTTNLGLARDILRSRVARLEAEPPLPAT